MKAIRIAAILRNLIETKNVYQMIMFICTKQSRQHQRKNTKYTTRRRKRNTAKYDN